MIHDSYYPINLLDFPIIAPYLYHLLPQNIGFTTAPWERQPPGGNWGDQRRVGRCLRAAVPRHGKQTQGVEDRDQMGKDGGILCLPSGYLT